MRWEDQELNHDIPENKFPEVFFAGLFLLGCASKVRGRFLRIDRQKLDELVGMGELPQKAAGARIDRLCLYYRLACRLGPGGDHYATLGTTHFWEDSESLYAILYISPQNDWFHIMVIGGESPNNPAAPNAGIASQLTGGHPQPGVGEPERSADPVGSNPLNPLPEEELRELRSLLSLICIRERTGEIGILHGLDRFVSTQVCKKKSEVAALDGLARRCGLSGIKRVSK